MTDKVSNQQEHDRALERIAELRAEGKAADKGSELAALEAAVAGYSAIEGKPGESKGRPLGGVLEDK